MNSLTDSIWFWLVVVMLNFGCLAFWLAFVDTWSALKLIMIPWSVVAIFYAFKKMAYDI